MAKMYEHKFTVEGRGQFPFDMLRYDGCFPAREAESVKLEHFERGERTVDLIHRCEDRHWMPMDDRWRSFGWRVVKEA